MTNDPHQHAPATLRNRDFILGILRDVLRQTRLAALGLHGDAASPVFGRAAVRASAVSWSAAPVALREPLRRRTLPSWVDWMEAISGAAETRPLRPAFAERSDFAVRNPKNRWPFQFVPVIALAICERLP